MRIDKTLHRSLPSWTALLLLALGLTACGNAPRLAALNEAHTHYEQVRNNNEVVRMAPLELERARLALAQADQSWLAERNADQTAHLSYLAMQRAQLAQAAAERRVAEARVDSAATERARLRAQAHALEAQRATQGQQAALRSAQAARLQAQSATEQAQTEAQRAQRLSQQLAELQAKPSEQGMVVVLQDVLFDVGQAVLRSGAQARLDRLAQVLQDHPDRRVMIEGFTDSTGSEALNLRLSQQRAEAVQQALMRRGVQGERIEVRGLGEQRPVATNRNAAGRQQNRRVEVVFSDAGGQFANGKAASQRPQQQ